MSCDASENEERFFYMKSINLRDRYREYVGNATVKFSALCRYRWREAGRLETDLRGSIDEHIWTAQRYRQCLALRIAFFWLITHYYYSNEDGTDRSSRNVSNKLPLLAP